MYGKPPGVLGVGGAAGALAFTGFPLLALTMLAIALIGLGFVLMRASMIRRAEEDQGGSVSLWYAPASSFWGPR
jgi:hypothetical protein